MNNKIKEKEDKNCWPHNGLPPTAKVYTDAELEEAALTELKRSSNAQILAQLEAADKSIIRALIENDTKRISEYKASQEKLRSKLQK